MTIETWYKIWCDECGTANWLCDGNTSDVTGIDIEGFMCRKCKTVYPMMEDDPGDPEGYDIGREKPR